MIATTINSKASDLEASKLAPTARQTQEALNVLRRLAAHSPAEAAALGLSNLVDSRDVTLNRDYPADFIADGRKLRSKTTSQLRQRLSGAW